MDKETRESLENRNPMKSKKRKLTVYVRDDVIKAARYVALDLGKSLSQLTEDLLNQVASARTP